MTSRNLTLGETQTNKPFHLRAMYFFFEFFIVTLKRLIYKITLFTPLKLHTTYILTVLVAYIFIPYFNCLLYRKQTNRTKQISKLACTINWIYNSYFRLLLTSLLTTLLPTHKLVKSLSTFKNG